MSAQAAATAAGGLFDDELHVVTAGIETFPRSLSRQSVRFVELDWQPPAGGDPARVAALERIARDPDLVERIEAANQEVLRRIAEARPLALRVLPAGQATALPERTILHSGPPIAWERMCGPQRRAVAGAIRFEGWAPDAEQAEEAVRSGDVRLAPCHRYAAVGPMTGVVSPSMPVVVVRNETFGNLALSTLNEGRGNTLWFGVCDDGTLERLAWIRDTLAPLLDTAFTRSGGLAVFDLVAEGLQMGDECHARHAATTSLLVKRLVPVMLDAGSPPKAVAEVVRFADANGHLFLNLTMAAVKATMDAAHGVPWSTVVTAMSRNGVDFMIRVAGLGDAWPVAPVSPMDEAVYYTGYSVADAAGDIGDSAIIETCGLGGMALAAAPSVAPFVGGGLADEIAAVERLRRITVGESERFRVPTLDLAPTPLGIEVGRVVATGVVPFITTGVLHETSPTIGQIGTGVARAPGAVFDRALAALLAEWGLGPEEPSLVRIDPVPPSPLRERGGGDD